MKTFYIILGTVVIAVILIVALNRKANGPAEREMGFQRNMTSKPIRLLAELDMKEPIHGIAGSTATHYYFSCKDVNRIIVTDVNLNAVGQLRLANMSYKYLESYHYTMVDSPDVWVFAPNVPVIIKTSINDTSMKVIGLDYNFGKGCHLSSQKFVIRSFDSSYADKIFLNIDLQTGQKQWEQELSEKREDGGLSSDGNLCYDPSVSLIFYVQYYTNRITCFDTNLKLVKRMHTIDTFGSYQPVAGRYGTGRRSYTFIAPPRRINYYSCISGGKLYVHSNIKADNETATAKPGQATIDTYDLRSGIYIGSFTIPGHKRKRPIYFQVYGDKLLVTYASEVKLYQLPV